MTLTVYADESENGEVFDLCGFVDSAEYWPSFSRKWDSVLSKYAAPYFHFREYATRQLYLKQGNAYYGWTEKKRDSFLYDLAAIPAESAVPVGSYSTKKAKDGSRKDAMAMFYYGAFQRIEAHWPNFKGNVVFVYDDSDNVKKWVEPLVIFHQEAKRLEPRIGDIFFDDDKKILPLQAADMLAYVARQNTERFWKANGERQPIRLIDFLLQRNIRPAERRMMKPSVLKAIVAHYKQTKASWKRTGDQGKVYYPFEQFPFAKYGIHLKPKHEIEQNDPRT